jgi:6-pyruvoyltetrahydropterin/6-carboxytetrahydropterin synthase
MVELFFSSNKLDNGLMIMDFGLMKYTIKDIIKSFDNAYSLWDQEDKDFKKFIYKNMDRVIEMPLSPSAESYSILLYHIITKVLEATEFNNGEGKITLDSVNVHETKTGFAKAYSKDLDMVNNYYNFNLNQVKFSKAIKNSWSDSLLYKNLKEATKTGKKIFKNPIIKD